jgi:hypothetical protein
VLARSGGGKRKSARPGDEARVRHPQRLEQPASHHLAERRVVDSCQQQSEQVGRVAVMERRPRLADQWKGCEPGDPVVGRDVAVDVGAERVRVGASQRPTREVGVGEAGAVGQQILERDRPKGRIGRVERPLRVAQHPHAGELRRPAADRVVQREAPFVEERQRDDRRDRLGHRRDPEQRIALDRQSGVDVAPAGRGRLHDTPAPPDQRRRARELTGEDGPGEHVFYGVGGRHGGAPLESLCL